MLQKSKSRLSFIKATKGKKERKKRYDSKGKEKKIKNKSYVKYHNGDVYMIAYFQNKKTKEIQTVQMNFYPAFRLAN